MSAWRPLVVFVLTAPVAACAWWMAGRPGGAVVEENVDRLKFTHLLPPHQECKWCHGGIETATNTASIPFPKESNCLKCHDQAAKKCSMCHTVPERPRAKPRNAESAISFFSHETHLRRTQGCDKCHQGVGTSTRTAGTRPSMDACLSCHNHRDEYAESRCGRCHQGMLSLPLRAVAEFEHGSGWMDMHGPSARSQGAQCLTCHSQNKCASCHSRLAPAAEMRLYPDEVGRSLLHRPDWRTTHPMEARADGDLCLRCHGVDDCTSCHAASGVASGSAGGFSPHPAGYVGRGGTAFHGDDARLQIETCAACHDFGASSNCVKCHFVGAVGGNPHPPGWSDRFDPDDLANAMCRTCHR